MKCVHEQLQQPDYQECLQTLASPLNHSHRLGHIWYVLYLCTLPIIASVLHTGDNIESYMICSLI